MSLIHYTCFSFLFHHEWMGMYHHEWKWTLILYLREENMFLPERFESKKTSPHHNGKLCAARNHFPHTDKSPGLLNIVQVCVTAGVKSINFRVLRFVRCSEMTNFPPRPDHCPRRAVNNFSANAAGASCSAGSISPSEETLEGKQRGENTE